MIAWLLALTLFVSIASADVTGFYQNCMELSGGNGRLHWTYFPGAGEMDLAFEAKANLWSAIGFQPLGTTNMINGSMIVAHMNYTLNQQEIIGTSLDELVWDCHRYVDNGRPELDTVDNVASQRVAFNTTSCFLTAEITSYPTNLAGPEDFDIDAAGGVFTLLWAVYNVPDPANNVPLMETMSRLAAPSPDWPYHSNRGSLTVNLTQSSTCPAEVADTCADPFVFVPTSAPPTSAPPATPTQPPAGGPSCTELIANTFWLCSESSNDIVTNNITFVTGSSVTWAAFSILDAGASGMAPADVYLCDGSGSGDPTINDMQVTGFTTPTPLGGNVITATSLSRTGAVVECVFTRAATVSQPRNNMEAGLVSINYAIGLGSVATSLVQHAFGPSNRGSSLHRFITEGPPPTPPPTTSVGPSSVGESVTGPSTGTSDIVLGSIGSISFGEVGGMEYVVGETFNEFHIFRSDTSSGWIAVAFARSEGSMSPADAMICFSDGSTVFVRDMDIFAKSRPGLDAQDDLYNVETALEDGGFYCNFTRDYNTGDSSDVVVTGLTDLNWAVGDGSNPSDFGQHSAANRGSVTPAINLFEGEDVEVEAASTTLKNIHGVFMVLGWGILIPIGVLIARVLKSKDPLWFQIHRAVQPTGYVLAVAGFIISFVMVDTIFDESFLAHAVIGTIVMFLGLVQIPLAIARPHKGKPGRKAWELQHWITGKLATVGGMMNCFLGIDLLFTSSTPMIIWGIFVGIYFVLYIILSVVKKDDIHNWP